MNLASIKPQKRPARTLFYPLLLLVAILLPGCGASIENSATRTALAIRNVQLATRMAEGLQETDQAYLAVQTATQQANKRLTAQAELDQQATLDADAATKQAFAVTRTAEAVIFQELIESARNWPALVEDSFDQPAYGWPLDTESLAFGNIKWSIEQGKYGWLADATQGFSYWTYPVDQEVGDFYLAVEAQHIGGVPDAEAGLVFHASQKNYWCFLISGKGDLFVGLRVEGKWRQSLPFGSSRVKANTPNHLAVLSIDNHYYFLINGYSFISIGAKDLPIGSAGLMISLWDAGDQASWQFDNYELRIPEEPVSPITPSP